MAAHKVLVWRRADGERMPLVEREVRAVEIQILARLVLELLLLQAYLHHVRWMLDDLRRANQSKSIAIQRNQSKSIDIKRNQSTSIEIQRNPTKCSLHYSTTYRYDFGVLLAAIFAHDALDQIQHSRANEPQIKVWAYSKWRFSSGTHTHMRATPLYRRIGCVPWKSSKMKNGTNRWCVK